jgi:hypothetical protein
VRTAGLALGLLVAATVTGATSAMFRFSNDQGDPVYSYTLPAGQAERGYQKIDPHTGQVLETVAPKLAPAELAEKMRREQALRQCRDELDRIYQLYSTEIDIDRAQEDTLESLETRVGQLQANLRQARRERDRLQSQAADAERAGREIPQSLAGNLQRSRFQIDTLEQEVVQRESEQDDARARYAHERERFRDGTCPAPEAVANRG